MPTRIASATGNRTSGQTPWGLYQVANICAMSKK